MVNYMKKTEVYLRRLIHIYFISVFIGFLLFIPDHFLSYVIGINSILYAFLAFVGIQNTFIEVVSLIWIFGCFISVIITYIMAIKKCSYFGFVVVWFCNAIMSVLYSVIKYNINTYEMNYFIWGSIIATILSLSLWILWHRVKCAIKKRNT